MDGLVDQLQADALNPDVRVSTLLRKVKVAAVKLGLQDALSWVDLELSGYHSADDLPLYRKANLSTKAFNPYQGWQAIRFGSATTQNLLGRVLLAEPIGNYEALLVTPGADELLVELSAEIVAAFNKSANFSVPKLANVVPRGVLVGIVGHVRDMVLDWALELARAGVSGTGLSFTMEERERALGAHIQIGEFHGSFNTGDAAGSNSRIVQGGSDRSRNIVRDQSIFQKIDAAINREIADPQVQRDLHDANIAMKNAATPSALTAAYQKFIGIAADHIGVFGPMLPALTAMLTN